MKIQKSRIAALAVALIMALTLAACGGDTPANDAPARSPSPSETAPADASPSETTPTETPSQPEDTPEPSPEEPPPGPDPIESVHTRGLFPYAFTAEDIFGNTVSEQTMGEKELFFVYRWATWCGACVAGFPRIAQMIEQYEDRVGFVMLLLDMENASGAASLFENNGIPRTNAVASVDGRGTFDAGLPFMTTLETGFIPEAVVIDAEGNVLQHISGGGQDYASYVGVLLDSFELILSGDVGIRVDKPVYAPGERIEIVIVNITQEMLNAGAWIGVFVAGTPHSAWEDLNLWMYLHRTGIISTFLDQGMMTTPGDYELRVFRDEGDTVDSFVVSVPFTISG